MPLLSDMMNNALAASTAKIASARGAAPDPSAADDRLRDALFGKVASASLPPLLDIAGSAPAQPAAAPAATKIASTEKTAASQLANDAMTYAEAIMVGADILEKLAAGVPQGLETNPTDVKPAPHIPRSTGAGAPAMAPGTSPAGSTGDAMNNDRSTTVRASGQPMGKTAADAELLERAKVAQIAAMREVGMHAIADSLEATVGKVAQDPSSPQPHISAPAARSLETDASVPGGPGLTNARAISITSAQARDANTRDAARLLSSTPVKDPVATAVLSHTEGLKVAADNLIAAAFAPVA
jgi:hypothetical protein